MKVLVIGASGGSGRAALQHLLALGHEVSAFGRQALAALPDGVQMIVGDAMDNADVERAVAGQDAVIVTLGIRENALRVRLFGPARTPLDVRSTGTRNVVAAMRKHGVRKLVVQTSFGVGPTRQHLSFVDRLFFELVLKPQIADTELQESDVVASGLDWIIVQPVHLTDEALDSMPFSSSSGVIKQRTISRNSVGRFLAHSLQDEAFVGRSFALSAH